MARRVNYEAINKNAVKNLQYVDNELEKAGYGYVQRLAILWNIQRESSGNPLAISSNGTWHGLVQWNKDRYRLQSNDSQSELQRQTKLLLKELEKTGWSGWTWKDQVKNAQAFKDTTDLKQAVDLFTRYFVRSGDIEGEITKRYNFAQSGFMNQDDEEYDIKTAKKVLPPNLIKAWQKNPEQNHLPTGYTDNNGNYHYLKSAQHESYPESREYERKDPKTIRAMSVYGNANDYVSKFPTYSPITSGTPKSISDFDPYNQTLVYKPLVLKNQTGGLIYKAFIKDDKIPNNNNQQDFVDFLSVDKPSFPVEPVQVYKPIELEPEQSIVQPQIQSQSGIVEYADSVPTSNPISTQTFHEETTPSVVRGTVEFKHSGIDVGNMQELINLMQDEGISFRITSGSRPGAKTSSGRLSHHGSGNALDITPIKGQTWDDLLNQMRRSKKFVTYMNEHGLGILDERGEAMQKKTGATGAHFHIGPDQIARTQFKYLVERWKTT